MTDTTSTATTGSAPSGHRGDAGPATGSLQGLRRHLRADGWLATMLLLPLIVLMGLTVAYPLFQIVWTSFFKTSFIRPEPKWVGLDNYRSLISDDLLWTVAKQSVIWTVGIVIGQFVVGLGVALLLNLTFKGRGALRAFVLIPWVMPGVLAGILWRFMYDPYLGLVNYLAHNLGLWSGNPAPLSDTRLVMPALIFAAIWKGAPFSVLMYLAALQSRPPELVEAARIDGAGAFSVFRFVTWPTITPVVRSTIILTIIWTFNYFDIIYVTTAGGPNNASQIAPTYIYELAFVEVDYGRAAAFGMMSIGVLAVFSWLYLRELREDRP